MYYFSRATLIFLSSLCIIQSNYGFRKPLILRRFATGDLNTIFFSALSVLQHEKCRYLLTLFGKGQIISKGLFGVLEFSQKTNGRICLSSENEFVCSSFGRIRGYQMSFRNYLTFSTEIGAGIRIEDLDKPNVLVPLNSSVA